MAWALPLSGFIGWQHFARKDTVQDQRPDEGHVMEKLVPTASDPIRLPDKNGIRVECNEINLISLGECEDSFRLEVTIVPDSIGGSWAVGKGVGVFYGWNRLLESKTAYRTVDACMRKEGVRFFHRSWVQEGEHESASPIDSEPEPINPNGRLVVEYMQGQPSIITWDGITLFDKPSRQPDNGKFGVYCNSGSVEFHDIRINGKKFKLSP